MAEHTESLSEYEARLERALKKRLPFSGYNRDTFHAASFVAAAFEHAAERILLISHKLDRNAYESPRILRAAREFLKKEGTGLDILVETDVPDHHGLLTEIAPFSNASVNRIPDDVVKKYSFNLMLVDRIGYRLESDRNAPSAIISINEDTDQAREFVEQCEQAFYVLKSHAEAALER